jgi:vancomycin resistance protein YoaR
VPPTSHAAPGQATPSLGPAAGYPWTGYAGTGSAAGTVYAGHAGTGSSGYAAIDGDPGPQHGRRRRIPPRSLVAGGIAIGVLIAAGGAAVVYARAGDIPRGTTVLGVDLGTMSRDEAGAAIRAELGRRADALAAPVTVTVGEASAQLQPTEVGLAVDADATISSAAAQSPGIFGLLFGSRTVAPVVTVDTGKLDAALRKAFARAGSLMTMPAVVFEGTTPKPVYPKPGQGLDPERSAQALREGWLSGQPVSIPLVEVQPATTTDEVDRLIAELAAPAVAGPVTIRTDRGNLALSPTGIARSLVLTADPAGKINPRIDEAKLRAALATQLAKVEVTPKEATVSLSTGKPRVVAGSGGQQLDAAALSRDILPILPKHDGREVTGAFRAVQPKTTTEAATRLGIVERVSTFTTNFSGGLATTRSQNIVTVAKEVDGAVVKPGETFSLNGHTGERGYAQGYQDAPVIVGGKLVPGVGGGVSQFTTTLFNAAYYAGLEDVEHTPHSYWFSRYPPVIESTIFYPTLDFKFRNDTKYGVLIDTSYTASSITVSMWSTKVYGSVTTQWSEKRNITKPKVIYLAPGPTCIPTDGIDGFTQDAWRIFRNGGKEIRREKFSWKYDAEPRYVCGTPPPPG